MSVAIGNRGEAAAFSAQFQEQLESSGIRVIRVIHSDLFGRQRAKQYPVGSWAKLGSGVAYSKVANAEDLLGVPVSETEFPHLMGHPDLHAQIDLSKLIFPTWEPDSLWVLASLVESDIPSSLCPRSQLENAVSSLRNSLGLTAIAAAEPEFYLFEHSVNDEQVRPYSTDGVSYTVDRVTDPRGAVGSIHRSLIDLGIGVTVMNREFSPGQFEINLHHDEAMRAADAAFLLKSATKELAILEGLNANFMAKPRTGHEGSGMHVHMSLWSGSENAFANGAGDLSETAYAAIAGLQVHAPALMAIAAPTVNSYKRLSGEGLSPRSSNWGENDRFTFIRIPPERGAATRLELRAGDASASPHLLFAGMLHAMQDGIERGLTPTPKGAALPRDLEASLHELEHDVILSEAFGEEFTSIYCALKRAEIASYQSTVTNWEWTTYRSQV